MCSDLLPINGYLIPCRRCDECLSARRNTWAARACAEAEVSEHVFAVTLTYNEKPGNREAARAFRYSDIVGFHKRLRSQIKYDDENAHFRFIVAGEIGSKGTKRVHWHCAYFSNTDISAYGDMSLFHAPHTALGNTAARTGLTDDHFDIRLNWELWPHGLVFFQRPDQGGMEYITKYVTKDQFSSLKSEGSKRFSKSDNHANGKFRMSKLPPLGIPFLTKRLAEHLRRSSVDPNLKINIPGYTGYWYLQGDIRTWYLTRLKWINQLRRDETGQDCPQWASLLSSLSENEKDMELIHGPQENPQDEGEGSPEDVFAHELEVKQRAAADRDTRRQTRRRCGQLEPCTICKATLNQRQLRALERYQKLISTLYQRTNSLGKGETVADRYRRSTRRKNPWCLSESTDTQRAFEPRE